MYVKIDDDDALEMLLDRLSFWTDDEITFELYKIYYRKMIKQRAYKEFNPMVIVDNDYVNYLDTGTRDEIRSNFGGINESKVMAEYGEYILYYTS